MYHNGIGLSEEGLDLAKSNNSKECTGLNFNILFAIVVMIWQFCFNTSNIIAIITINRVDSRCFVHEVEAIQLDNCAYASNACLRNQF